MGRNPAFSGGGSLLSGEKKAGFLCHAAHSPETFRSTENPCTEKNEGNHLVVFLVMAICMLYFEQYPFLKKFNISGPLVFTSFLSYFEHYLLFRLLSYSHKTNFRYAAYHCCILNTFHMEKPVLYHLLTKNIR
ncbi:Uncharacterized protein dnm_003000 [Desulfonema magnum]|uniref:Uncharacterized protein n=1 Tax=Desulfonema magnum TaxID=45655 RepID=A0A975BF97_9BACT|nr:Uncharacterized protein dnm_003000 [Desulfonema magnum]